MNNLQTAEELTQQAIELLNKADELLNAEEPGTRAKAPPTDIIVILDRSGSMSSIREDMEGGFDSFVAEQREDPAPCFVTLTQFDTEYEIVYERRPLQAVPPLNLVPRGMTALRDAIGRTLCSAIDQVPAGYRVAVVVITDGHENSSREFTNKQVRRLIEECEKKRDWQFVYLGADAAAVQEGCSFGFADGRVAQYDAADATAVRCAYEAVASNVRSLRAVHADVEVGRVMDFSEEQRESMK